MLPFIKKNTYSHQRGRRKGKQYQLGDVYTVSLCMCTKVNSACWILWGPVRLEKWASFLSWFSFLMRGISLCEWPMADVSLEVLPLRLWPQCSESKHRFIPCNTFCPHLNSQCKPRRAYFLVLLKAFQDPSICSMVWGFSYRMKGLVPVKDTYLGCRLNPWSWMGQLQDAANWCVSLTPMFFSVSSPFYSF